MWKKFIAKIDKSFVQTQFWASITGAAIAVLSLIFCLCGGKTWARVCMGILAIAAPTWFWLEFSVLRNSSVELKTQKFEEFKYAQELSRTIWLAVIAVIGLTYGVEFHGL